MPVGWTGGLMAWSGISDSLRLHGGRTRDHRRDDVLVARATADVPFQPVAYRFRRGLGIVLREVHGAHHHARGTEAALQAVLLVKGLLHGMQRAVRGSEALDGGDGRAVETRGQGRAAFHGLSVDVYHAGAALAGVAA